MTTAERDALPDSAFCGPGRSYPITSQGDVDAAAHLIGQASDPAAVKACIIRKAHAKGWTLPAAWQPAAHSATFDAALTPDPAPDADGVIRRTGKLFTVGVYPDKDFTLSEAEADAAAAAFTPVLADYEHTPGPLDGHLGTLEAVWRDGPDLRGTVAIPAWLDPLLADTGRKVSLAWDRATKTIAGWGWVRHPRISDAALYAAFAGARHNAADTAALNAAHDHIVTAGATNCPATAKDPTMSETETLPDADFLAKLKALFVGPPPVGAHMAAAAAPPPDPRIAALEQQLADQATTFATAAARQRQTDAAAFATAAITQAHRLPPAAFGLLTAALAQAEAYQAATPTVVTFALPTDAPSAPTGQGSLPDLLRRLVESLPPLAGFSEQAAVTLPPGGTWTGPDPTAPASDERAAALLALTPVGRAAAQHQTNGAH